MHATLTLHSLLQLGQQIDGLRQHFPDQRRAALRALKLFGRQADQVQGRVAANLVEQIAYPDSAPPSRNGLECWRHYNEVIVAVRAGVAGCLRSEQQYLI